MAVAAVADDVAYVASSDFKAYEALVAVAANEATFDVNECDAEILEDTLFTVTLNVLPLPLV